MTKFPALGAGRCGFPLAAAWFLLVCLCVLAGAGHGRAAAPPPSRQAPVRIEADRMETDQKSRTVVFAGSVVARQGDLRIEADEMQVFYAARDGETGGEAIERLTARGRVTIAKQDWTASGDALEYFARRRYAVLTGDARAWQGGNMVRGERIELYLDEGRTVVDRGGRPSGRVKAFFYPAAGGERPAVQGREAREKGGGAGHE